MDNGHARSWNLHHHHHHQASGFFGLVASLLAFYLGLAKLLNEENSYFTLPTGEFNKPKH
jgi:succinate-acetate transporter protein